MPFQKGNKLSKGVRAGKTGRAPELVKRRLKAFVWSHDAIQFLEDAVLGKDVDVRVTKDGEVLRIPASVSDRRQVWVDAHDRVCGKPVSILDLNNEEALFIGVVRMPSKDQGRPGGVRKT